MKRFGGVAAIAIVVAMAFSSSASVAADRYTVNLTRKDSNLYKVDGTKLWVQTRYCYVYAYGEEAALSSDEVVFLDDADKCDVEMVLKEVSLSPGNYNVRLTREDDNLYSTLDGAYVRTNLCLNLALGEDAVLRMKGYGGSVVFLDDGDKCDVETVYSKVRL